MAVTIIVLLAILRLSLSYPDSSQVNVDIKVNANDNGRNEGFLSCVFGFTCYPNGYILTEECMQFQCMNGVWTFTGIINWRCGTFIVFGEPHIQPFEEHIINGVIQKQYSYQGIGNYVIAQNGLRDDPNVFGAHFIFEKCASDGTNDFSCVKFINYCEKGFHIDVIFCLPDDLPCKIKVMKGKEVILNGNSVKPFYSAEGTVLVFRHDIIAKDLNDLECINFVGSRGLSFSACQHISGYAFVYVWVMPSLKNQLYGLCDLFTDHVLKNYTMGDGLTTTDTTAFGDSWELPLPEGYTLSTYKPPTINRCPDGKVPPAIQDKCNNLVCGAIPPKQCADFKEACQFDLCYVPQDPASYVDGYASHMRIQSYLDQLS